MPCLDENTIVAFAEGGARPAERAFVERHVADCDECRLALVLAIDLQATPKSGPETADRKISSELSASHARPRPGHLIGRYTILGFAGRGGMGEVYAAYDPALDRRVAIKLLRSDGDGISTRTQGRLLREAKALAKLSHSNVVAVHDVGTSGDRAFIAMEFIDGVTLGAWLTATPRSRREILAAFLWAGAGLAAAHRIGIVHRDFKPGNVMIGHDGSVRVTDFGLARATEEERDASVERQRSPGSSADDEALTRTGELVGTPLYMAPEQFRGAVTDARTDQFAFCVALYEALYRTPPFGQHRVDALKAHVTAGRVEPPPPHAGIPASLRRVLLRGLSVAPEARWPSMADLVAALKRESEPSHRWRRWTAGALSLAALAAVAGARVGADAKPFCRGGTARLGDVWPDVEQAARGRPRRDAVQRAFLATSAPDARGVWDRTVALLDSYRARWLAGYVDACEATQIRHDDPPGLFDLRMACLDESRLALSALTDVFARADRETVGSAVDAVNALPSLDRCNDRQRLETGIEPPRDLTTRRRVDEVRTRAATAKALNDSGKHEEARRLIGADLAVAREIGYRPLLAETLVALSRTFYGPNFRAEVLPIQKEALTTALACGRDDLAAEAAVGLVASAGGFLTRDHEAEEWADIANAILDRIGPHQELLRSWLLLNQSMIFVHRHEPSRVLEYTERSVAIKERVLPPDHPDIANSLNNEAEALSQLGRTGDALRVNQRAYDIFVRAYGPSSIEVAFSLSNRGEYLIALGRPADALEPLQRAIVDWEAHVGRDHPFLAFPLTALGRALVALGRPREAVGPLMRALRSRETGEQNPALVAETRSALERARTER